MGTATAAFSGAAIEGAIIAAIILVPLFFNLAGNQMFQLSKGLLLRFVTVLLAAVWLILLVERTWLLKREWRVEVGRFLRKPLVLPALILVAVQILSTFTSTNARVSFIGSYERLQGTLSIFSYVLVFFSVLGIVRRRDQVERWITLILFVSLPICLYGILQNYGMDPIPWTTSFATAGFYRVFSTLGNPIFLGGYLVMILPLTLGRIAAVWPDGSKDGALESGGRSYFLLGCYLVLLAAQSLCLIFTQSRGPFVGLLVGLSTLALLRAILGGHRVRALIWVGAVLALFLALLFVNLSPLSRAIEDIPYLGRISRVFDTGSRTGQQRTLLWEGVVGLVRADPLRALVGYGPETFVTAFDEYYPAALIPLKPTGRFDRAHNQVLDVLATKGFVGLAAHLVFVTAVFYHTLRCMGLVKGPWQRRAFFGSWFGLGLLFPLASWIVDGSWRFGALALSAGMIASALLYLVGFVLRFDLQARDVPLLPVVLFSALVAHLVEVQFGVSLPTTELYFWLYAGVLGVWLTGDLSLSFDGREPRRTAMLPQGWRFAATRGLWTGFALATASFSFTLPHIPLSVSGWSLAAVASLLWVFSLLWFSAGAGWGEGRWGSAARTTYAGFSALWLSLYLLPALYLSQQGRAVSNPLVIYYLYVLATIAVFALVTGHGRGSTVSVWRDRRGWSYLFLAAAVAVVAFGLSFRPMQADAYVKNGVRSVESGLIDQAVFSFQRATEIWPHEQRYSVRLAGALVEKAGQVEDFETKERIFGEARMALQRARGINPRSWVVTARFALLYQAWGQASSDPAEKEARFEEAITYYREAQALNPHDVTLVNGLGYVYALKGNSEKALSLYRKSLRMADTYARTYFLLGDAYLQADELRQAARAYESGVKLEENFLVRRNLALLYQRLGKTDQALQHARIAHQMAPSDQEAALEQLIAELGRQPPSR